MAGVAQIQQVRDLLECVWPAALETAWQPFRSRTWAAAMGVVLGRDGGDLDGPAGWAGHGSNEPSAARSAGVAGRSPHCGSHATSSSRWPTRPGCSLTGAEHSNVSRWSWRISRPTGSGWPRPNAGWSPCSTSSPHSSRHVDPGRAPRRLVRWRERPLVGVVRGRACRPCSAPAAVGARVLRQGRRCRLRWPRRSVGRGGRASRPGRRRSHSWSLGRRRGWLGTVDGSARG